MSPLFSVMSWIEAALHPQHLETSIFRSNVGSSKPLEAGVHMKGNPDLTSFLVDDLEDLKDNGLPDFLDLLNQLWIFFKQLLRFLVEVFLFEFLVLFEHLRVLVDLEFASQIEQEALQDVESIVVEVVDHNGIVLSTSLDVLAHGLVAINNRW